MSADRRDSGMRIIGLAAVLSFLPDHCGRKAEWPL